jgi:hypothetical protein
VLAGAEELGPRPDPPADAAAIQAEATATRIQAVEFGRGPELAGEVNPLRRLATATGGSYRYIDVTRFPRAR